MAQQVKALAVKPDYLSSVLRSHMEGENGPLHVVFLISTYMLSMPFLPPIIK